MVICRQLEVITETFGHCMEREKKKQTRKCVDFLFLDFPPPDSCVRFLLPVCPFAFGSLTIDCLRTFRPLLGRKGEWIPISDQIRR